MALDPMNFSEIVRTLSPGRFRRFMESALDIEEGYESRPYGGSVGVKKNDVVPPDIFRSILRYEDVSPVYHSGQTKSRTRFFVLTHHVPSFISDLGFLDVLAMDLRELKRSDSYNRLVKDACEFSGDIKFYYGTNKDYFLQWKDDQDGWRQALDQVHRELNLEFHIDCVEPYTIGVNSAKSSGGKNALLETLREPDGIWIDISESGVEIRPFLSVDVMFGGDSNGAFVLNVDTTPLAKERLTALQGLRDILTLEPPERRIAAFLTDHPEIFRSMGFVEFRWEITIGPDGERPDFLLETEDRLWELLELKRVVPQKLFVEGEDGPPKLARYLKESLRQCREYLRILETEHTRNLLAQNGMRIGQPRITLLAGREQYPKAVVQLVKRRYGEFIGLKSFDELYDDCKRKFAVLMLAMKDLAGEFDSN